MGWVGGEGDWIWTDYVYQGVHLCTDILMLCLPLGNFRQVSLFDRRLLAPEVCVREKKLVNV